MAHLHSVLAERSYLARHVANIQNDLGFLPRGNESQRY